MTASRGRLKRFADLLDTFEEALRPNANDAAVARALVRIDLARERLGQCELDGPSELERIEEMARTAKARLRERRARG